MKHSFVTAMMLLPVVSSAATLKPSEAQLSVMLKTVNYVFEDSFAQAYLSSALLEDSTAGRPVRHLLFASVVFADMMDSEDFGNEKLFLANVDSAIETLNKWLDKNPKDPWGHFFMGSAYGYKAVWQGESGSWLKSMLSGLRAKGHFFDALKYDPKLYDAYTGIGNYHYWSTVKLRKYLPFLADNRNEGMQELLLARDSSLISVNAASVGLAWALLNEKKYIEAARIGNDLKASTFDGRNSLWILGGVYWSNGNLKRAALTYDELIASLERAGNQNYYNLIFCTYRKGVCLFGTGDYTGARDAFQRLLSFDVSKEIKKRHKLTYEKTNDYLARIEKTLASRRGTRSAVEATDESGQ